MAHSAPAEQASSSIARRRLLGLLLPLLVAAGTRRSAAQAAPPLIGWLKIQGPRHTPGQLQAFREGMSALGLIEGRDYVLEQRYAGNDRARLPGLAKELLARDAKIIVATSQPSIVAAGQVTKRVPVIGRMNDNPVGNGMAASLARPGGNITGVYAMTEELNAKRLSLLKEAVPTLRRVGVLLQPHWSNADHDWEVVLAAGRRLSLDLLALNVRSADDVTAAFAQAAAQQLGGIMTFRNPTVVTHLRLIGELSRKHRLRRSSMRANTSRPAV